MKKLFKKVYKLLIKKVEENKKNALLRTNEYLEKFDYSIVGTDEADTDSNYIWQLWNQGEQSAPPLVKKCLQSVKKFNQDKKIVVLDDISIDKYIEIPEFIKEKYKKSVISHAHYSDYIRTCLLAKYGGIWIDATVLLTDKIPQNIMNQDFFVFKNPLWYNYPKVPDENLFKLFLIVENNAGLFGSSWFIVSKPNNPIVLLQKQLLEQYWCSENKLIHYFLYHIFISKSLIKNNVCKKIFENMHSLSNQEPHILQNIFQEEFNAELFEKVKQLTTIHKLTYKFEKIAPNSYAELILKNNTGDI